MFDAGGIAGSWDVFLRMTAIAESLIEFLDRLVMVADGAVSLLEIVN